MEGSWRESMFERGGGGPRLPVTGKMAFAEGNWILIEGKLGTEDEEEEEEEEEKEQEGATRSRKAKRRLRKGAATPS